MRAAEEGALLPYSPLLWGRGGDRGSTTKDLAAGLPLLTETWSVFSVEVLESSINLSLHRRHDLV